MKRIFSAGLSVALACSLCLTPVSALTVQQAGALLEQFYVDQIPDSVLAQEDLDSMLEALGDPYTVYMTTEEYSAFPVSYPHLDVYKRQAQGWGTSRPEHHRQPHPDRRGCCAPHR